MRFVASFVALAMCFGLFPNVSPLSAQNHLVLARHFRESPPGESRPVLVRELLRQALLIAAREEMGVRTSDEVLGMAITKKGDGKLLVHPNLKVKADATTAEFGVYSAESDDPIWKKGTTATYIDSDIGVISRDMQKLSRTEFPALLSKLGLKASEKRPVANKAKDSAVPSDALQSIRSLHNDFDAFPQCMAIQKFMLC